ncbi:MAG: nicotinate (nicotinamide) nucleotide adenylyltransferase [Anaerolineae bacterium]|jgi:nicotinate-nucleotide adenylyltransferase|nr:nicotinate (nicotinamide) nucleotide adenylyltransferase [Anaerolineae bacterium]MBT7074570.1 nicotinate (nicotinamide) nucleotide adenylyltransferase [Anaerolineae bacterium]MBT7783008.1 nicotinate (nicotinamide) nucleotide adenylyltransferase [Anaerolineae bacterium]
MTKERIGIFGGTFDPPHLGHLILACEVRSQLNLDRLLWVLTPDPPHKQDREISPLAHRRRLVDLAISDNKNFELSLVEAERDGPHYSVDTVRIIRERNLGAEIIFLMGGDSLKNLHSWHRLDEFILACDEIGVMRRPNDEVDAENLAKRIEGLEEKIKIVNAPLLEIASREIRRRVREGLPVRYYLPREAYAYILDESLYGGKESLAGEACE